MISVIIPVYNELQLTDSLLSQISSNSTLPCEVILIDNGSVENIVSLAEKYNNLNIIYIRNKTNIGVNQAWNQGFEIAKGDLISVLNNDVTINSQFFEKMIEAFKDESIGIVIPCTVIDKAMVITDFRKAITMDFPNRQGWAFTIKKEVLDKIGFIPKELILWFGDDYIFEKTRKAGYKIKIIVNNFIYHQTSSTLCKMDYLPIVEEDKKHWLNNKERWLTI